MVSRGTGALSNRLGHAARAGWTAVTNFADQEGMQWSGAVAFYLILSVPPLVIAAFSIAVAVVGEGTARDFVTSQVTQFLPAQEDVVRQLASRTIDSSGAAVVVSLAFLLFSGSRVFATLIAVINLMWKELPEPGFWRRQLTRIAMLVTTGLLLALAGAIDVAIAIFGDEVPRPLAILAQSQVLPAAVLVAALFLLFKIVPRRAASWSSAITGAVVGAILLRVAQAGFTAYLATVANFRSAYGPIAGAAIVMTWALVASVIILLAAHLVAVLNPGPGSRPDSAE